MALRMLYYDRGVLGIQLHGAADAVGLLTGHERAAAAAEQIQHDAVWRGAVFNGIV